MVVLGPLGLGAVGTRRLIDTVTLGLAVAVFARVADHEILLEALWVVVAIGAAVYGLRGAVLRIALTALAALAYTVTSTMVGLPLDMEPWEARDLMEWPVLEWPVMIGIALIVAFLADGIATSARRYARLYREASERLLTAQEQERSRLARDLHDGVGQTLTAVIMSLGTVESQWADTPPSAEARAAVTRAQTLAAAALEEARDVAGRLRPARIHEIGLGAALVGLARDAGVAVEVRFDPTAFPPGMLDPEPEIDVYRIVQEAISNAARHSGARKIWIDGSATSDVLRLEVGDDGTGLGASGWTRGLGLAGMQERAAILRARFEIRSRPGEGTIAVLVVPRGSAADSVGRPLGTLAEIGTPPG
jgi:signal transduction histidine kinase